MDRVFSLCRSPERALLLPLALLLVGQFALPAGASTPPAIEYQVQPVLKLGEPIGDGSRTAVGRFRVGSLNDAGQLAFALSSPRGDILLLSSGGAVTPLVVPGGPAPQGTWPERLSITSGFPFLALRMNQQGRIVFTATDTARSRWLGVFQWDPETRQVTAVAQPDMTVGSDIVLTSTQDLGQTAAINNRGEIVFAARPRSRSASAVFVRGQDGQVTAVALPNQAISNGKRLTGASWPTINEAGQVGFLAGVSGLDNTSLMIADKGVITPVALVGENVPGAGRIADTNGAWVNSQNGNVLGFVTLQTSDGTAGSLVLKTGEGLVPVLKPGMEMPGGGAFRSVMMTPGGPGHFTIGDANDRGQHAFLATIVEDGTSKIGAYLMDADGRLSLIARMGSLTDLGVIDQLGIQASASFGISLNNRGQVAVPLRIRGLPSMVAVLTPNASTGAGTP